MDFTNFFVRLSGQKGIEVVRGFTFFYFPNRCPLRPPYPRKRHKWPAFINRKPSVAAATISKPRGFSKRCHRNETAIGRTEPALPMLACGVPHIGGPTIRLHLEELVEVPRLAFGAQFVCPLSGRIQKCFL